MLVLGVETSCDETSVAIVRDGKEVLSNVIYTQIDIHKLYGGVVPEVASRHHLKKITIVFDEALKEANVKPEDIDLVAVTSHPGLIGSLLVGINAAKTFALAFEKKYIEVDHIVGHIYANYIESDFSFPMIALVVSGGHTELRLMKDHYDFTLLGETLDDAVGESYDKVGRVMNLEYPAGAKVDKLAHIGNPSYKLPFVYVDKDSFNFSFSGLKSAVLNEVNKCKMKGLEINIEDLAASFQNSVVRVLTDKTISAAKKYQVNQIVVAGGVAANHGLRESLTEACEREKIKLTFPRMVYCTDNAAMIAVAGYFKFICENSNK